MIKKNRNKQTNKNEINIRRCDVEFNLFAFFVNDFFQEFITLSQ